jgi:hypothetical protein
MVRMGSVASGDRGPTKKSAYLTPPTKKKPGFWTRQMAFEQVRSGSNIHLLSFSLVTSPLTVVRELRRCRLAWRSSPTRSHGGSRGFKSPHLHPQPDDQHKRWSSSGAVRPPQLPHGLLVTVLSEAL